MIQIGHSNIIYRLILLIVKSTILPTISLNEKHGIYICVLFRLKIFFSFLTACIILLICMKYYKFYIFINVYLAHISLIIRKLEYQKNLILYLKALRYSDIETLPWHVGSRPELKSCLLNPFYMFNNLLILSSYK